MSLVKTERSQHSLRGFIEEMLSSWHVPGLALAIVQDGQITHVEGYGLRDLNQSLSVSPETLFPIASCTKAFTVMALGMLVDAGKLEWDQPVISYLPTLKLWDAYATERISLRDLLTHRSGLPGHDMMWYATQFNQREIFDRLRFLEPTCDLRTSFQYQNLMYMVAGLVVEEIVGCSWQYFIQKRILDPLGMNRTVFSTEGMQNSSDYALPYRYRAGHLTRMPFHEIGGKSYPLSGAGGMVSCASDMAKWLQFLLNGGKVNGQALVCNAILEQMFTPQIFVDDPTARKCYGYEFMSYGLGWGMRLHKGKFLLEHDGMVDGFYALASMMPRDGLGIVALTNGDAYYNPVQENQVPNIITYTLYDQLLSLPPTDWHKKMRTVHADHYLAMQENQKRQVEESEAGTRPSHPIESYLGDYIHPGYGRISIQRDGKQLHMLVNQKLDLPMVHVCYDVFEILFEVADQRQRVEFRSDFDGEINQVLVAVEPRVKPISFTRVPHCSG